jgi:glucose-6-phosphate isomerase
MLNHSSKILGESKKGTLMNKYWPQLGEESKVKAKKHNKQAPKLHNKKIYT